MKYAPVYRRTRTSPAVVGKDAPLTEDDYDLTIYGLVRRIEQLEESLAAAAIGFDAGGNPDADRPSVPASTTVLWFNVPSRPAALGPRDAWEDAA